MFFSSEILSSFAGCRGRDRMIVRFTTTYEINVYRY